MDCIPMGGMGQMKPIKHLDIWSDTVTWNRAVQDAQAWHYANNVPDYVHLGKIEVNESIFKGGGQPFQHYDPDDSKPAKTNDTFLMDKYGDESVQAQHIKQVLSLKSCVVDYCTSKPGSVIEMHVDRITRYTEYLKQSEHKNLTTWDRKAFIILLTDHVPGQNFMFGKSIYTGWKKYDAISFPWYITHGTCNASHSTRYSILIQGL